uniref:Aldehyde dehydrogenase domain-containing protein n=1 Tax=Meloidogyne javanica TaxID=6303 RepID=A0A915LJF7_MELJA
MVLFVLMVRRRFVHASAILRTVNVPLVLIENQQVEFDIIEGLKGPEAVCVSGPGGVRVGKTIGYIEHVNELSGWEVRDNGKPISEAKADILSCADTFEYFAGIRLAGEHFPYGLPTQGENLMMSLGLLVPGIIQYRYYL